MVAADARTAVAFSLSPGQAHDAPEGRRLLSRLGRRDGDPAPIVDRACQDKATRRLALDLGYETAVPSSRARLRPWQYDCEMDKRRNQVEHLFRRLKGFRRIFTRFEKLDTVFLGFMLLTLIVDEVR